MLQKRRAKRRASIEATNAATAVTGCLEYSSAFSSYCGTLSAMAEAGGQHGAGRLSEVPIHAKGELLTVGQWSVRFVMQAQDEQQWASALELLCAFASRERKYCEEELLGTGTRADRAGGAARAAAVAAAAAAADHAAAAAPAPAPAAPADQVAADGGCSAEGALGRLCDGLAGIGAPGERALPLVLLVLVLVLPVLPLPLLPLVPPVLMLVLLVVLLLSQPLTLPLVRRHHPRRGGASTVSGRAGLCAPPHGQRR